MKLWRCCFWQLTPGGTEHSAAKLRWIYGLMRSAQLTLTGRELNGSLADSVLRVLSRRDLWAYRRPGYYTEH